MSGPSRGKLWAGAVALVAATAGATIAIDRALGHATAPSATNGQGAHGDDHGAHGDDHGDHEGEADRVELTAEGRVNAGIEVAAAGPGEVDMTLTLPGQVTLNGEALAHVTPRVGGIAREVKSRIGDKVKRGDVLALIDSRELSEISREARSSRERVKLADANLTRIEKLYKEGIVPEKEYLAAKQAYAEAKIDEESAAQSLATTGTVGGGTYRLVAPIDGTVIEKHITLGEVVKDDQPAFVVADLSTLWIDVTIYSKDLAWVAVGQPVRVRAEGIKVPAAGKISFLSATATGEARTTSARVLLDNSSGVWKAGLFVVADIAIERIKASVVVPEEAVQALEGRSVVFVEDGDGFRAQPVKVGHVGLDADGRARFVEIESGLVPGARYVSKGAFTLKAELAKGSAGHEH